jgi:valyl-tRNA synthetase
MSNAEAYITLFFQDLEELNVCLGLYLNIIIPINEKYRAFKNQKDFQDLEEKEVEDLKGITKEIRYNSVRINTKLQALIIAFPSLKGNEKTQKIIKNSYNHITTKQIPEFEIVNKYIIELNKLFIQGVGNQLLMKSQQYYQSLTQANNISGFENNGKKER